MSKKQMMILIGVGLGVLLLSGLLSYCIASSTNGTKDEKLVQVGKYKLHYGTYKALETEYDPDTEKITKKELKLTLTKDYIELDDTKQTYTIKNNSLYVKGTTQETELYQVIANDKLLLLAGEGLEFEYEK